MEINKIYHNDCIDIFKKIEDESIDLILTDPPYGINFRSNSGKKRIFDKIYNDDNLDFFKPFIKNAFRCLKKNSCLFVFCRFDNYPFFYNVIKHEGFNIKNCLVWEKNKSLSGLGDLESSFFNNYEFILFAMKGRKILFNKESGRQYGLIKDDSISNPLQIVYPTQKPLPLLRKLIKITTKKGDTVLDCFCGSGSVCLAANEMYRGYIGIDVNISAVNIAKDRLYQQTLFGDDKKWIRGNEHGIRI